MNQFVYNASMLGGTLALSAGTGWQWGTGAALMVFGGLVIVLTGFGAWLSRKVD